MKQLLYALSIGFIAVYAAACAAGQQVTRPDVEIDTGMRSPGVVEAPVPGCVELDYVLDPPEAVIARASIIVIGAVDALSGPGLESGPLPIYEAAILVEQAIHGDHEPGQPLTVAIPGNCPEQGFIQPGQRILALVEKRVIGSDERLILYPAGNYLLTAGGQAVNALDGQNMPLEQLLALIDALQSRPGEVESARQALIAFFDHLTGGRYQEAAALYGGSYEVLVGFNPDLNPQDRAALLQNACTVNGYQCLRVQGASLEEEVSPAEYSFRVTFEKADGSLFTRGPCCGADGGAISSESQFAFSVVKSGDGRFLVQELPVYVP